MKITKTEKVWILLTVIFYVLYNLPGVPSYGDKVGTMLHAALTLIPLWVIVFLGTARVFKIYQLKENNKGDNK